ncbi:MAG: hypothetical protein MZU79_04540 [Anaerotruncus sp.]|nr:hypothetical protein [Anaerotruncus sp.]
MTNDEFIALGEEKIDAFLKASGAPDQFKAKQVIESAQGRADGHQEDGRDDEADAQEAERGGRPTRRRRPCSPGATRSSAARASSPGSRSSTRPSATSRSAASCPSPTTRRRPR